ncbi:MAG: phosphomannomutase/phosphoglucomutase [Legionellaceae bacterium]|nr:phosphomannomutase/phosphoglucomutase [Legionellaceae bacterium]
MHSYQCNHVARDVFRAYDIRGIVGDQLDDDAFYSIGKAIACRLHSLGRSNILLARDGRLTSDALSKAVAQGLLDSGIDVVDLGTVPTPVMYYATHVHGIDSGLMVTGSHNPADYNGIKMVLAGTALAQDHIQMLYNLVVAGQFISGQGHYQQFDILDDYQQRIVGDIQLKRPLKVVVDCGNGISGVVAPQVLRELGCDVVELYCDVDGRFPNHHPDPTVEANLVDLKAAVAAHQADLGLAFDGDGDRLGVVTNLGELIWPDRLMMFYAPHVIKSYPGGTIVFDVKCSSHLATVIRQAGGVAKMCPTGHSLVKQVMKDEGAALAGEMSGHLFFKDRWYGFDDALYSACRLLEIISLASVTVSDQFADVPNSVNTPEIKIPIFEDKKFAFMQAFVERAHFPEAELISIDGLRVEYAHGWGLLRASNTTPCLVARFEASDQASLSLIQAVFKAQLKAVDEHLMVPF